jgi:hypothetical protein
MTTIAKRVQLPHCPMLEELERSAKGCLERAALSRSRDTPPSAKEAATMQDVWSRILKHKGCLTCNSAGPAHFPRLRTAWVVTESLQHLGRKR